MIKNIIYNDQATQLFINRNNYDTIIINQIEWRIDRDDNCEPYVFAKLTKSLPQAIAQKNPVIQFHRLFPRLENALCY